MPVRDISSPNLWTCVTQLLKEEDEHVCVLPMTTLIKPVRAITLLQIDTTATAATTKCPPGSAELEPCKDFELDVSTGVNNGWRLVQAPPGIATGPLGPMLLPDGHPYFAIWQPVPGAQWASPPNSKDVTGEYVYELVFNVCCTFSNTQGEFTWRSDDESELFVNGQSVGRASEESFRGTPASVSAPAPLVLGENKLVMKVINGAGPTRRIVTGFALKGTIRANA